MTIDKDKILATTATARRRQAEEHRNAKKAVPHPAPTNSESQRLIHELEVHQIELEMQNDELAKARDAMERVLDNYTDLYDFAPLSYLTLDRAGVVQAANLTVSGLLGVERARLLGLRFGNFVTDKYRPVFTAFLGTVFTSRVKESCEVALLNKANRLHIVQIEAISTASGTECRLAVIDITERKRIEEALRDSERFHRAIGESIDYGVWICDPEGRNLYASDSFLQLLGLTQKECAHLGWGDAIHPDDAEFARLAWKECVRTEGVWDIELRFRGVDRQWHPILVRGVPMKNDRGLVTCWAGINLDISRIKETEKELLQQSVALHAASVVTENDRRLLAAVMETLPVGVAITDLRGEIMQANSAFERIWGGPGAEINSIAGHKNHQAWRADTDEPVEPEEWASALALHKGETTLGQILRIQRFDGGKAVILNSASPVSDIQGNTVGCAVAIQDITRLKQTEAELQKAHDELELRIRERTGELSRSNEKLIQEIEERQGAEKLLRVAYEEIQGLKDRLQAENIYLQQEVDRQFNFGEIVGKSNVLSEVFLRIEQVAPINATVLLQGETGTGKGVVARAIHSRSMRKGRPMITVNCATLPAALVESELFGRERGAFTGADARQIGRFELADGGTVFLDEIGELPLELQAKLLRVLQDGEFERLGSSRTIKADIRIIAATNRNLAQEVRDGKFRSDLFYRLNVFPIAIPPLWQRKEDIPLLVNHFVARFNLKMGKAIDTVSSETLDRLQEYHWPGNVRELESIIERAVIVSPGKVLQVLDRFENSREAGEPTGQELGSLVELEQEHILQALKKTGWRIEGKNGAALILGLNSSTLRSRMRKYGIHRFE